jgi:hypothetical protein
MPIRTRALQDAKPPRKFSRLGGGGAAPAVHPALIIFGLDGYLVCGRPMIAQRMNGNFKSQWFDP